MLEAVLTGPCEPGEHHLGTYVHLYNSSTAIEGTDQERECFKLKPFATTWHCLCNCWEDGVFINPLLHRFWKLSVQVCRSVYY